MSADGPGWSPDIGKFWFKDGLTYCEDGDVLPPDAIYRISSQIHEVEDYSAWSDEKRAAVRAEWAMKHAAWISKRNADHDRIEALRKSALAKLTDEEREAIEPYLEGPV